MKFTINLDTNAVTPPTNPTRVKRGDSSFFEIQFTKGNQQVRLSAGAVVRFGVKASGQFGGAFLAQGSDFAPPESGNGPYTGYVDFNTEEVNAALLVTGPGVNGNSFVTADAEFQWTSDTHDGSSQTIPLRIDNDVIRGNEDDPTTANPEYPAAEALELLARKGQANGYPSLDGTGKVPAGQLPTGFIGSTPHYASITTINLFKALTTVGLPESQLASFRLPGEAILTYCLTQEDTATSGETYPLYIRPNDRHVTTNPVSWRLVRVDFIDDVGAVLFPGFIRADGGLFMQGASIQLNGGAVGQDHAVSSGASSTIASATNRFRFTGGVSHTATLAAISGSQDATKFALGAQVLVLNDSSSTVLTVKASDGTTVLAVLQPGDAVILLARAAAVTWTVVWIRFGGKTRGLGSYGSTYALDLTTPEAVVLGLNIASTTVTVSGIPDGATRRVKVVNSVTITALAWAAGAGLTLKWPGGVAPTPTLTNGKADEYEFTNYAGNLSARQVATNV